MIMLKSTHNKEISKHRRIIRELMHYYEHRADTNGSTMFLTAILKDINMELIEK